MQTTFAQNFMENKIIARIKVAALPAMKVAYWLLVLAIAWAYVVRPQDAGFVRQEITLLHLFLIGFPFSLFVNFWILVPLIGLNYLFDGFLSTATTGRVFDHYFVFVLGGVNAVAGYHQWFTLAPRFVKKISPTLRAGFKKILQLVN